MSWCREDAIGWSREDVRTEQEDYISGTERERVCIGWNREINVYSYIQKVISASASLVL